MARARSPNRDKAKEMYLDSNGEMKLKDIAEVLGVLDTQVRKWKSTDKWDNELKGTLPKEKRNVTNQKNSQKFSKTRNRSGNPNPTYKFPKHNSCAEKHGFFSKYLPEETLELIEEIKEKDKLDILWENITIQYAAIIRAQRIMFVESKEEMIKELKKEKDSDTSTEREYEFQFAWDRQATFLNAQSRAMSELRSLIKQYDELINSGLGTEEQKLRIEKLKVDIEKSKGNKNANSKTVQIVDDIDD